MSTSIPIAEAAHERLHLQIGNAITNHLEASVSELESLLDDIKGTQAPPPEVAKVTEPTLADFMSGAAEEVNSRANRVSGAVSALRSLLL